MLSEATKPGHRDVTSPGFESSLQDFFVASDDDYSGAFSKIRGRLVNRDGVRLVDRIRDLKPIYHRAYIDMAIGYVALISILAGLCAAQAYGVSPFILAPLGAVLVAYWTLYLTSFIHEASHWNLAASRSTNDRICNVLLSWFIGLEIGFYRKVHFEHHRSLGTVRDTEFSYFFPLNAVFIGKSVSGIRIVQTLWSYFKSSAAAERKAVKPIGTFEAGKPAILMQAAGASIHAALILALWWFGYSAAAAAWLFGIGAVLPLIGGIRQLLEHRSESAQPLIDYSKTDQGACARMFGAGLFARTFGSAGFNRHLLHHWEPQVSYTRLADLERFLADTPLRVVMDRRRSSYAETFRRLFSLY